MIDVKTWGRALAQMPNLSPAQWQALDPVGRWLVACRASVLFMTLTAALVGGILAWRSGYFDALLWLTTTVALVFAHATNNLLNDYTDSRRGIDNDNYFRKQYGVHVLEDGLMSLQQFWRYTVFTGGIAIALGSWLVWERSGLTLHLMLAGVFFVLFYTWPLKYFGLGEPAVLLVWGPLMVGGTFYVQSGVWDWDVFWLSAAFALGPTAVLFGKHTDKLQADAAKGVKTLPVLLGEARARYWTMSMILTQYVLCLALVIGGFFGWPLLLVLPGLVWLLPLIRVFRHPAPSKAPVDYPTHAWPLWFSAHAFVHTRRFTSLFLLGLLLESALH